MISSLDLNSILRRVSRRRSYYLSIIGMLGLCAGWLGVVAALFYNSYLAPLPVHDSGNVVGVYSKLPGNGVSYPNFIDYKERSETIDFMSAYVRDYHLIWNRKDALSELKSIFVSDDFFSALQPRTAIGSFFSKESFLNSGKTSVVVISHRLWVTEFEKNEHVLGQAMTLNGRVFTIVGVASREFTGIKRSFKTDAWIPVINMEISLPNYLLHGRGSEYFNVIGRLARDVDLNSANLEMNIIAKNVELDYPDFAYNLNPTLEVLVQSRVKVHFGGSSLHQFYIIMGVSVIVLLIAISNYLNLLIGDLINRTEELAIRISVGGSIKQVFALVIYENFLLLLLSMGAGVGFYFLMGKIYTVNYGFDLQHNPWVLVSYFLVIFLLVLFCFLLVSFIYINKISSFNISSNSRVGGRVSLSQKLLLLFQIGMTVSLLLVSTVSIRALRELWSLDPGYDKSNLILASVNVKSMSWNGEKSRNYYTNIINHLERNVIVQKAGLASVTPMSGSGWTNVVVDGLESGGSAGKIEYFVNQIRVSKEYSDVIGLKLLKGRFFTESNDFLERPYDSPAPFPILIDRRFAELYFGTIDCVNEIVYKGKNRRSVVIVGVVENVIIYWNGESRPTLYIPITDYFVQNQFIAIYVKIRKDMVTPPKAIEDSLREFNNEVPIRFVSSIEEHLSRQFSDMKMVSVVTGSLSALALIVSFVGILAVFRADVMKNIRQLGIKMALGASEGFLIKEYILRVLKYFIVSSAGSLIFLYCVNPFISKHLYGAELFNLFNLLLVLAIVLISSIVAALVPLIVVLKANPLLNIREC